MKDKVPLKRIIAQRELVIKESKKPVLVEIGTPQFIGDGWDWVCPYKISGLGETIFDHVHGVDALQTLQLVSCAVVQRLNQTNVPLTFLGQEDWQSSF